MLHLSHLYTSYTCYTCYTGLQIGQIIFIWFYMVLQGCTGVYRDLQAFTGDCKMEMAVPLSTGIVLWVDNYTLIWWMVHAMERGRAKIKTSAAVRRRRVRIPIGDAFTVSLEYILYNII